MCRDCCICPGNVVYVFGPLYCTVYMCWHCCTVCEGTVVQYMNWDGCICVGMVVYLNGLYAVMYTQ